MMGKFSTDLWFGKIPNHWQVAKVKRLFKIVNGGTPRSTEPDYWTGDITWITPEDLSSITGNVISESRRQISFNGLRNSSATLVPAGSIVLSTRAPIGYVAITGRDLSTNQGCKSLVPLNECNIHFFLYQILAAKQFLQSLGSGTTFAELSATNLGNCILAVPPQEEQNHVADYLYQKNMLLAQLIEKKQRFIQLLQEYRQALITQAVTKGLDPNVAMKNSGVEWLGEVPEHWRRLKLSRGYHIRLGKMLQTSPSSDDDTLGFYLRAANVQWVGVDVSDIKEMWLSPREKELYRLEPGDLIVCEGGDVGRSAIWNGELSECYIQNAVHRVRPRQGYSNEFLYFWLFVLKCNGFIDLLCNKATIAHLTSEKLAQIEIFTPSFAEQLAIVKHIKAQVKPLEKLIKKTRLQIDKLEKYRESLIYHAVTGKIDVRGEA